MTAYIVVGSVAALIAAMAQSCIGFGFSMILAPALLLVLDAKSVVPTVLLVDIFNCLLVSIRYREHILPRIVIPLAIGGVIGFAAGIRFLFHGDQHSLRLAMGIFVLVFTVLQWRGWRRPIREKLYTLLPVGFLSGLAGGASSMSGPPVVLFMANQDHNPHVFRASLISYFTFIEVYGIALFWWSGALTHEIIVNAAVLIPAMLFGSIMGFFLASHFPEHIFKKMILFRSV